MSALQTIPVEYPPVEDDGGGEPLPSGDSGRPLRSGHAGRPHVLIIVQNLPVPFDRRVWLECRALTDAGYHVSVVCPKAKGDPGSAVVDGVALEKYRPWPSTNRKVGFIAEYLWSFFHTARLVARVRRRRPVDVIQTCNPPDIFWPIGLICRALGGTKFVFDQHDLCPEVYESRFPEGAPLPLRGLRLLEGMTYRTADHVIATNRSYRDTAAGRGGKGPDDVTVVRTGPDPDRLRRRPPAPHLRRDHDHLVAYLGVMGPQDGVDIVLRAAAVIVHELGRTDIAFTLIGSGDCFDELVALSHELELTDHVAFTGRAPDDLVFDVLSTADLGLSPDPKNPLNDVSTMNKTMEYMAFELPVVAFDLRETRVSAADAALYVQPNVIAEYAKAIVELVDDEPRRARMGALGRSRVENKLAWRHQRGAYVAVYDRLVGRRSTLVAPVRATQSPGVA